MAADSIITALAAVAHQHRLAAFRLLGEAGPNGLAAGRLGIPPSSLTFHLQQLFRAELVSQRRLSRQLIYAANFATMNTLVAYLTENCCGQGKSGACTTPVCRPGMRSTRGRNSIKRKSG